MKITVPDTAKLVGSEIVWDSGRVILPSLLMNRATREQISRTIERGEFILEIVCDTPPTTQEGLY